MSERTIAAHDPHQRRRIKVLDSEMAYVDTGAGAPIVFLHGNPTSSYLWRNVIPHVHDLGRCLAPDLIGMGESRKAADGSYRFVDHMRYLDAWFEALEIKEKVIFVLHDWGSALGFHWAKRHKARVQGIAYMEAVVQSIAWSDWPERSRELFQTLRTPVGEELILKKNIFIEKVLPGSILRNLLQEEMSTYRKPYLEGGESRRPMLTWPREIPVDGEPEDVVKIVNEYSDWLAKSEVPKLFVNGQPGAILTGKPRKYCRGWPNQDEVSVQGVHFLQEDSPHEIGAALRRFVQKLRSD
ncbi:MAG: haloalkane dehalogenase [Anaerolineae bacterium]|nr:haloalkane dehalogenase [Anaerolineae bacterium]